MQRPHASTSCHFQNATVQRSDLAIRLYGYGLAAARVAGTEGMSPCSARACSTSRGTPRSSRATPRVRSVWSSSSTPRAASSPLLVNHWGLRPNQKFDVRAQLAVGAQHLMEVADASYLQAADLVAADDRSSCEGAINVHEGANLDTRLVTQLAAHTRLYVVDSCWLDDSTKRVLIVLEGDDAPLGWATAITPDGIPLIYLFARPLYEVAKQPLKVRQHFEQSSKFRKQLSVGTRMHVIETRRTNDGAQRVCIIVIGEEEPTGWVTSIKPDGKRTLKEVKGLDGASPHRSPRSSRRASIRGPDARYAHMSTDALEQAALEFISQRQTFIPSSILRDAVEEVTRQGAEVVSNLRSMTTSFLDGGEKPLSVQLGEIFQEKPFSLEEMMAEAESSGSNPAITGKISKMEFRMFLRKLLNQTCMLSSMTGAAEIDMIFPMLDTNDDGEIDIRELERALCILEQQRAAYQEKVEAYRKRDQEYAQYASHIKSVLALTLASEEAFKDREAETRKATGPMLGAAIAKNGWTAAQVASMWTGDAGSIDKAGFRSKAVAIGMDNDAMLLDQLFDSLCQGSMDGPQLEQALAEQMQLAESLRPKFRTLNIRIIDSTKPMKTAQTKHRAKMQEWASFLQQEDERASRERAEGEALARASKQEKVKRQAFAAPPAAAPVRVGVSKTSATPATRTPASMSSRTKHR